MSGFGEGGEDFSWAMNKGLVSGDMPRMDY